MVEKLNGVQSVQETPEKEEEKSLPTEENFDDESSNDSLKHKDKFKFGDIVYHGVTHDIFVIIGTAKGIRKREDKYKALSTHAYDGHSQIAKSVMELGDCIGSVKIPDFYPKEWDTHHVVKVNKKANKELDMVVIDTIVKLATEPNTDKVLRRIYTSFRSGKTDIHTFIDELKIFKKEEKYIEDNSYYLDCAKKLRGLIENKQSELNNLRQELMELREVSGIDLE